MAALERASVTSFSRLARELTAHGAPASLVTAATRSMRDEQRHAKSVGRLASAHGATRVRFARTSQSIRPLTQVALENAESGCVLETYGAAEAGWQAAHATDPAVRAAMGPIARDEARHAALAWKVHSWAHRHLGAFARRQVSDARRRAVEQLVAGTSAHSQQLGLPDAAARAALINGLQRSIWSAS